MFNSIPRCHDAESESDFYRLHINFCVLRSRKKKKEKNFSVATLGDLLPVDCRRRRRDPRSQ